MKRLLIMLLLLPLMALAHGPTRQTVEGSVVLNAPPDKVWAMVGDFTKLQDWHPAVKSTEMKDANTRLLTLQDGNTITEELKSKDDATMTLKYRIIDMTVLEKLTFSGQNVERKTLPVDTYSSIIKVTPEGNGSKLTWTGKFYPAWLYPPPAPPGMDGHAAIAAVEGVYKAGLDKLVTLFGGTAQ